MSERFSRQSSVGLSGRGTAPPKHAPNSQRRHTLSSMGDIPLLPPRRVGPGPVVESDSDSEQEMPRVRVTALPPTSGRGRPRGATNSSLPGSRNATPIRGPSPVRYLDGSPKPMIVKTMPFGRTNSQPVYSEAAPVGMRQRRASNDGDASDTFAGTYSSGAQLSSAHSPAAQRALTPMASMPPLAPTHATSAATTATTATTVAASADEPQQRSYGTPQRPQRESQNEAPMYPTEDSPVAVPIPPAPVPRNPTPVSHSLLPSPQIPDSAPPTKPPLYSPPADSPTTDSFGTSSHPPLVPPLYQKPPRAASPPLARATAGDLRASPRPTSAQPREAPYAAANTTAAPVPPRVPTTRAPAASAATLPRGPPPLAPRTAVDDGWSGFSPRPEVPGRRAPAAGSARGVPPEKPPRDSRHYTQSSRRPTQSVQTARERAAQRRRAASTSPTAHRTSSATPQPGERETNTFPGAKRVEENDRVSTKHVVLLTAGVVTAIVTAVVLIRAITRSTSTVVIAIPKTHGASGSGADATRVGGGGGGDAPVGRPRRGTLPVLLGPPVGARPQVQARPQPAQVKLSSTGENPHEVIADIRGRVIGALTP